MSIVINGKSYAPNMTGHSFSSVILNGRTVWSGAGPVPPTPGTWEEIYGAHFSGAQYVILNQKLDSNYTLEVSLIPESKSGSDRNTVWGDYSGAAGYENADVWMAVSSSQVSAGFTLAGSNVDVVSFPSVYGMPVTASFKNYSTTYRVSYPTTNKTVIGAYNEYDTTFSQFFVGSVMSFKIKNASNTVIANCVAVKNSDTGVITFKDTISDSILSVTGTLTEATEPVVPHTIISGAQFGASNYMNTGINLSKNDVVSVAATNLITSGNGAVVGAVDNTTTDAFYIMSAPANGVWELRNGSSASYATLHTGSRDEMQCTAARNISAPLYVGDANYDGGAYAFKGIIHEVKITRSGTDLMDLVPVIKTSDNLVYLYDRIGNTYYNCGGGLIAVQ